MYECVYRAFWYFLPALVANNCPLWSNRFNFALAREPVSTRWLGVNKTKGAYIYGSLGGVLTIYIQSWLGSHDSVRNLELFDYSRPNLWFVGFLMGFGAIAGDHIESFFKRLLGKEPGKSLIPFDQLDFMVGGVLGMLVTGWIGWGYIFAFVIPFFLIVYPVGNGVAYLLGLRKSWF